MAALKNKNIVFVISGTGLGGAERQSILLARGLRQLYSANVFFVCFGKAEGRATELLKEYDIPYKIIRYVNVHNWKHFPFAFLFLYKFWKVVRSFQPDILLPYCYEANLWSGLIKPYLSRRLLLVWNQRDEGRGIRLTPILRSSMKNYGYFIANSDVGGSYLTEELLAPADKVSIIYNGVEECEALFDRNKLRQQLGFAHDDFLVVMIANLHKHKDHATLLSAWKKVLASAPDYKRYKLLLAGYISSTYEQLMEFVTSSGMDGQVIFMGPVKDIPSLLHAVDLSALCTFGKSEGLPNAVLESMAAGLPVIGTDTDALKCALGKEMEEWLSPERDTILLAENIQRLIANDSLRQQIGLQNKARQQQSFSAKALWENTNGLLADLINEQK